METQETVPTGHTHVVMTETALRSLGDLHKAGEIAAKYGWAGKARNCRQAVAAIKRLLVQLDTMVDEHKLLGRAGVGHDVEGMHLHHFNSKKVPGVAVAFPWEGLRGKASQGRLVGALIDNQLVVLALGADHDDVYQRAHAALAAV